MNPPQHMQALAYASECRSLRACLKRDIRAGEARLSELLRDELPEWLQGEPIGRLVCAMDRVGAVKMRRLLAKLQIPERKAIGKLTTRQRLLLSGELAKLERRRLRYSEVSAA